MGGPFVKLKPAASGKRVLILSKQNRRRGFTLEQEAEHLSEGAGVGVLPRPPGGSDAPESRQRRALRACSARAERGCEIIHRKAVGAELVRGGEILANVAGGSHRGICEIQGNEQPVGGRCDIRGDSPSCW